MKNLFFILGLLGAVTANSQTALAIPDTIAGPNYSLTMHQDSVQFFPGKKSYTYAFNQYSYLGPTLIFNKGTNINITVNNQIDDTTTVHWHGIHLPAMMDGGPHTPIMPGVTWNPQFTVMDHAATYWYHPHLHMKTAVQAIKGAAGLIIVRDPQEAALNLPRTYGKDDFPIVVQCQQYDSTNQAMPLGMNDSTILVNGARANYGHSVYGDFPAQIVRMRILNASGERAFNFGFSGNKQFYQIASDGGLLDTPYLTTRVRLAPGERAEILLDLTGLNGQLLYLMSYASELPMGTQGGPTMPMPPWSSPMDSPLNGVDFNVMQINVIAPLANPVTTIPSALVTNTPYSVFQANTSRTIRFSADSIMVMDGPFYFNGNSFDMMRVDYEIPLNNTEIWTLVNETMVAHPFHIHDVQFYVLDRGGNPPGPEEMGRKDVVLVPPQDSVIFITKFEDFADSLTPYMYHCHILMHEDAGMMGQFVVKPLATGIKEMSSSKNISIFPNPATHTIYLKLKEWNGKVSAVKILDISGKEIFRSNSADETIKLNVESWAKGIYLLELTNEDVKFHEKILIR